MQSVGPAASTKPAKYPTKLRRNYPRSRNGCLTCRQRKKKCDEIRPHCTACQRNELECVWPLASAPRGGAGRGQPQQPQLQQPQLQQPQLQQPQLQQPPLQQPPLQQPQSQQPRFQQPQPPQPLPQPLPQQHHHHHHHHQQPTPPLQQHYAHPQYPQPQPQPPPYHHSQATPSPSPPLVALGSAAAPPPRAPPSQVPPPQVPPGNPYADTSAIHDDELGSAYDDDAASAVPGPRDRKNSDSGYSSNWEARHGNSNTRRNSMSMSALPGGGSSPANRQPPHSSALNLFEHKRHWKTYLPMLAAWNGVEGSSTSLNVHSHEIPTVVLGVAASGSGGAGEGGGASGAGGSGGSGGGSGAGAAREKSPSVESGPDSGSVASPDTAVRYGSSSEAGHADNNNNSNNSRRRRRNSSRSRRNNASLDDTVVQWVPSLNSFVFPYRSPDGFPQRVTNLTPVSPIILRHYIVETGPAICAMRGRGNPFMTIVLPLAYNDDLVMHCIIALAGTHMSCRMRQRALYDNTPAALSLAGRATTSVTPFLDSHMANAALHDATTRHYSCVLRNLRIALHGLDRNNTSQVLRLLLVQILLACYEGISWNTLNGGIFAHLSASRQLIAFLRAAPQPPPTADERSLLGVLLELYTYVTLVNRIVPDGSIEGRTVVRPETIGSAKVNSGATGSNSNNNGNNNSNGFVGFDEDFVADPGLLAQHDFFGFMVSGMQDLFALMPRVSRLASQRYDLSQRQLPSSSSSLANSYTPYDLAYIQTEIQLLRSRAQAWQLPADCVTKAAGEQERVWWKAIGETYRAALLIYIATIDDGLEDCGAGADTGTGGDIGTPSSLGGASTTASTTASSSSAAYQPHIQAVAEAVLGTDLAASRFTTIMLWPLIVTGSVLAHPEERLFLVEGLRSTPQVTWGSLSAADLMEQLWVCRDGVLAGEGPRQQGAQSGNGGGGGGDPRGGSYFGPEGLARLMRDNDISMCVF